MIDFQGQQKRRTYEAVVPLINVVFLLLIFFLLAGTMQQAEPVDVTLPVGELDEIKPPEAVTIYVADDGFVYIFDQIIEARFAPFMLRSFFLKEGHRSVQVKADQNADAETIIELMAQMREIDVEEISLITERK
ncbi:MAG TPA: hypothetical protein DCF61_01535 [Alphaproteobacteria bacterium]|nr:hypothetical protein [Alphaproteobacteria bacterium]HAM47567.1 hypothetical protein [Alphaproteobacteria bacterium]HBA44034.1 hypothetical protein [Alphaproteobacteria bacterium]HBC54835.1 hypothetical protein [Alphaproteobacteria bacterium]